MDQFLESVKKSLDNDLASLLNDEQAPVEGVMQLQMLRIMRGRPFRIDLQAQNQTLGWSPDGVHFYPSEPGTYTTGGGPVPPETK